MFPIIFQTSHFTLYTVWIFVIAAIITATIVTIKLGESQSLKLQFLSKHSTGIIISAILGARLFAVLLNPSAFFPNLSPENFWNVIAIWDNQLSALGAIIGIALYLRHKAHEEEQDFARWLDVLVPAGILALTIGHVGNFFDGQGYGRETMLPWGVQFENYAIKYAVPIHPTQIYAALYSIGIFLALTFIGAHSERVKENEKGGFIATLGITLYALMRFIEEFFRGDDTLSLTDNSALIGLLKSDTSTWIFPTIRIPQVIALIVFILGAKYLYKNYKNVLFSPRITK